MSRMKHLVLPATVIAIVTAMPAGASAQVTRADYERAQGLRARLRMESGRRW